MSEQTTITNTEKLPVPSINILQNQEKQIIINSTEAFNLNDKKSLEFRYTKLRQYLNSSIGNPFDCFEIQFPFFCHRIIRMFNLLDPFVILFNVS